MNKKQIVKIKLEPKYGNDIWNGYGICFKAEGDDRLYDQRYLLEDGRVLIHIQTEDEDKCTYLKDEVYPKYCENNPYQQRGLCFYDTPSNRGQYINNAEISATRNVPEVVRKSMEKAVDAILRIEKGREAFEMAKANFYANVNAVIENVNDMAPEIRKSRGILEKEAFLQTFKDNLSSEIRYAIGNSKQRDCFGMDGKYEIGMSNKWISISRTVCIEKHARPSYTYLEYDDTRQMESNAEKNPEYQADLKRCSKPLPVKEKIEEYLSLGDKNTLTYQGYYNIEVKKPLTEAYAIELAEKFCGITKKKDTVKETSDKSLDFDNPYLDEDDEEEDYER